MNDTFIKLLALLLTSYWWFPVLRTVALEIWRVTDQRAGQHPAAQALPAAVKRASDGWDASDAEERGPMNASWSLGRRPVQRREQSFADRSRHTSSLTSFGRRQAP